MKVVFKTRQRRSVFRNKQESSKVLVTDANRGSTISIIRSLGRKGCYVIAGDSVPDSLGFCSRYAQEHLVYPAPETAASDFVEMLWRTARNQAIDLIIPVTDAAILPLAKARSRFKEVCALALPENQALEMVTNKAKTVELAKQLQVPTPRTCLVSTAQQACEAGDVLGWPLVLKPQVSRLYRDQTTVEAFEVCYANTPGELAEQMRRFENRCQVLLQEYCSGTGYGVEILLYQGQPLAAFQHKRLREVPINGGASAFRESVPLDPELYGYSTRLLKALNWTGLAMVEFKVGPDGPKLMEINGRVWGSLPLAVHSGMDFPSYLVALYLDDSLPTSGAPITTYATGIRAHNLELEMLWIGSILRGKQRYPFLKLPGRYQGAIALLDLLNPMYKFDILSLEDPRPGLAEIPKIVRKFSRKLKAAL